MGNLVGVNEDHSHFLCYLSWGNKICAMSVNQCVTFRKGLRRVVAQVIIGNGCLTATKITTHHTVHQYRYSTFFTCLPYKLAKVFIKSRTWFCMSLLVSLFVIMAELDYYIIARLYLVIYSSPSAFINEAF